MYCQECGTALQDGVKFCPNCGTPAPAPETTDALVPAPPVEKSSEPADAQTQAAPVGDNGFPKALTLMIFSIVGATLGCIPQVSLLGIIFSAIARGMVKRFRDAGYQIGPRGLARKAKVSGIFAKVGSIVSLVGLIVSIVVFVVFLCVVVALIISAILKDR